MLTHIDTLHNNVAERSGTKTWLTIAQSNICRESPSYGQPARKKSNVPDRPGQNLRRVWGDSTAGKKIDTYSMRGRTSRPHQILAKKHVRGMTRASDQKYQRPWTKGKRKSRREGGDALWDGDRAKEPRIQRSGNRGAHNKGPESRGKEKLS